MAKKIKDKHNTSDTAIIETDYELLDHQYISETFKGTVITGFIVDLLPHELGTNNLVIGHCSNTECGIHRYYDVIWLKNDQGDEPQCPSCFKKGTSRRVYLMFMFNLTVLATDGSAHNLLVFDRHAEHFLGCTLKEYLSNKEKRLKIRDTIESCMVSTASAGASAPLLTFCVYGNNGENVLLSYFKTTPLLSHETH